MNTTAPGGVWERCEVRVHFHLHHHADPDATYAQPLALCADFTPR